MRIRTAIVLTALLSTVPAAAAVSTFPKNLVAPLYQLEPGARTPRTGVLGVPGAIEEYLVALNPKSVAANPPAFLLDLPGFAPLEAVRTRFVVYDPTWKSWIGTLRPVGSTGEGEGYIHLGYHGQQLTATIDYKGERFRIVGGLGESHRLARLSDDSSPPPCAFDELKEEEPEDGFLPLGDEPELQEALTAVSRLDVLAVYPKAYFGFGPAAEAGVFNFIADSISMANDVFTNSGVNATYNLVGIVPITGAQPPSTGLFEAIIWLNTQPSEIANLRNAFGADIVTIYIPWIWDDNDYCGIANLPRNNNTFLSATSATTTGIVAAALNKRAFTANRDGCGLGDYTLGHEIGHNMGLRHDNDPGSSFDLEPNGKGFLQSGSFATVMGCYCTGCFCTGSCSLGPGAVCNRIAYFSDPAKVVGGVTIGATTRNNTQAAKNEVATYAGFKAQSANTPPTANFTVSCASGTCNFNASSSTDNVAIPAGGYWWDFGDGTTGTGKTPSHTYTFGSFFWVHLVVTDSGGQKDVTLGSATP